MRIPHPSFLLLAAFLAFTVGWSFTGCDHVRPGASAVVEPAIKSVVQIKADGGTGSGVVVDSRGFTLTCAHVVEDAHLVTVHFDLGDPVPATVVAVDKTLDLALIKVDMRTPSVVRWSNSSTLRRGDIVYSVGFPYGIGKLVSQGTLSGHRDDGMLIVDASLNHGQSGGPLFDGDGCLVGINKAIFAPGLQDNFCGIGVCITGNVAHLFVNKHLPLE